MIKVTITTTLPDYVPEDKLIEILKERFLQPVQITELSIKGKRCDLKVKLLDSTVINQHIPGLNTAIKEALT